MGYKREEDFLLSEEKKRLELEDAKRRKEVEEEQKKRNELEDIKKLKDMSMSDYSEYLDELTSEKKSGV
jgi:hypothetical protein